MRAEIVINKDIKLISTKDEFGYSDVLETFDKAKFIRIITFNISKESDILINKLDELPEEKDVILVTNIPGRFKRYTSQYARSKAKTTINNYIERLNPENYYANLSVFFNFENHSKIIMSDKVAYIGSSNFSDESSCNSECGILIRDKNVINEIDKIFIQMQIEEAIPYYSSKYTRVFMNIANLLNKVELYYEDYYWSFFQDSGHPHIYKEDVFRGTDAELSPTLVEEIETLVYEIEETILEFNEEEIYQDVFEELDLSICEDVKEYFGSESDLEMFSRFDVMEKTNELFEKYQLNGDPDEVDYYAQKASDDAAEMHWELIDEIYEVALEGRVVLENLVEFLSDLLNMLEERKEVNQIVDNT